MKDLKKTFNWAMRDMLENGFYPFRLLEKLFGDQALITVYRYITHISINGVTPTVKAITKETNVPEASVFRAVNKLALTGLIEAAGKQENHRSKGGPKKTMWRLRL